MVIPMSGRANQRAVGQIERGAPRNSPLEGENKKIMAETKDTQNVMILAFSELDAAKILFSFIITFLLWFFVATALLLLFHLQSVELKGSLLSIQKVFSFLGLSVVGLTVLTWRVTLRSVCLFFRWYTEKYARPS